MKELDLPLKRNQLIVAKFISQIREDDAYWCKELLAAENNMSRQEILTLKVKNYSSSIFSELITTNYYPRCRMAPFV